MLEIEEWGAGRRSLFGRYLGDGLIRGRFMGSLIEEVGFPNL
jgi:hypothetical protein